MTLSKLEKTTIGFHLLAIDLAEDAEEKTAKAEELFETIARWMKQSERYGYLDGQADELKLQIKKYNNEQD